ncbi:hypothetical protein RFI_26369, partial [Reticulomyxa filosa]
RSRKRCRLLLSCPLGSGSKKCKTDNGDTQSMDTPGSIRARQLARQLARQNLEHVGTDDQNWASESEQGDGNKEKDDENNKNRGNVINEHFARKRKCLEPTNDFLTNRKNQMNDSKLGESDINMVHTFVFFLSVSQ